MVSKSLLEKNAKVIWHSYLINFNLVTLEVNLLRFMRVED